VGSRATRVHRARDEIREKLFFISTTFSNPPIPNQAK
jgi:hypothetical protein